MDSYFIFMITLLQIVMDAFLTCLYNLFYIETLGM